MPCVMMKKTFAEKAEKKKGKTEGCEENAKSSRRNSVKDAVWRFARAGRALFSIFFFSVFLVFDPVVLAEARHKLFAQQKLFKDERGCFAVRLFFHGRSLAFRGV